MSNKKPKTKTSEKSKVKSKSSKKSELKSTKSKSKSPLTNKKCMEEMTVKDIKHHPKYTQIEGRSAMNKEELCKALVKISNKKTSEEKKSKTSKKEEKPKKKIVVKSEPKTRVVGEGKPKKKRTKSEPVKRKLTFAESPKSPSVFKPRLVKADKVSGKIGSPLAKSPVKIDKLKNWAVNIKPLPKRPEKLPITSIKLVSPLKTPKNTDLRPEDIFDLTGSPAKSTRSKLYLKPIPKTAQQAIRIHSQRKIHGAPRVAIKPRTPSPVSKSPFKGKATYEDNFVAINIDHDGEETVLYGLPGEVWQSVIDKLPKSWGKGKLVDTTFVDEEDIAPLSTIPRIPTTVRFEPEDSGIFSFLF